MRVRICIAGLGLLVLAATAGAQTSELAAGGWEIRTMPEFPGIPFPPAPKTSRICITAEALASGLVPLPLLKGCEVASGGRWEGALLHLKLTCPDFPDGAEMRGAVAGSGQVLQGQIELIRQPQEQGVARGHFIYRYQGRWLGASCGG